MALSAENRSIRERNLYFNESRIAAFDEVKGETILVNDVDAIGQPIKRAVVIPDDLREFTYAAYDMLIDQVKRYKKQQEQED